VPEHAEIIVDTEVQEPEESAAQIIAYLEQRALIPVREPAGV
jgi:adenylylsulfate kinase-like enzyme